MWKAIFTKNGNWNEIGKKYWRSKFDSLCDMLRSHCIVDHCVSNLSQKTSQSQVSSVCTYGKTPRFKTNSHFWTFTSVRSANRLWIVDHHVSNLSQKTSQSQFSNLCTIGKTPCFKTNWHFWTFTNVRFANGLCTIDCEL